MGPAPLGPCELLHRLAVTPHWFLPSLVLITKLELAPLWFHRHAQYLAGRGERTGKHEATEV